jgi:hypothetical protein
VCGGGDQSSNDENTRKKKKSILDASSSNDLIPYFVVDKDRYTKNRVWKIPRPQLDFFSGHFIYSKTRHLCPIALQLDPVATDFQSKQKRWSLSDLKIFFEKYFIYGRAEFDKITPFLTFKTIKDVIDLFYVIKKRINLAKYRKQFQEQKNLSRYSQVTLASDIANQIMSVHFR